jgi:hypothetical protein
MTPSGKIQKYQLRDFIKDKVEAARDARADPMRDWPLKGRSPGHWASCGMARPSRWR